MNTENSIMNCTDNVREVAERFSVIELNQCMDEQRRTLRNSCSICMKKRDPMDTLARASYVRMMVDKGMTLNEAYRDLGVKIRGFSDMSEA